MSIPDSSRTQFWTSRWEAGRIPWDLGGVPPALVSFLSRTTTATSVLIPGCGSGYEVKAFAEAGYEVTAIDLSLAAVLHAREVLGPLGERVHHANFFKHDFGATRFGMVYERGFLCSLPPDRWPEYRERMKRLLTDDGRLVGLFLYGEEPEPPPFPLTDATAEQVLGGAFRLGHSEVVTGASVPVYQGMERWQEWQRRGA